MTSKEPLTSLRMFLLRGGYLLLGGGLALTQWAVLLRPAPSFELFEGVVSCMLVALSLLAILGLFRPLAMLPVLLFELAGKSIWAMSIAVPQVLMEQSNEGTLATLFACAFAIPIALVVPWDHVWRRYFARTVARA